MDLLNELEIFLAHLINLTKKYIINMILIFDNKRIIINMKVKESQSFFISPIFKKRSEVYGV
jgi:hypothetical protein